MKKINPICESCGSSGITAIPYTGYVGLQCIKCGAITYRGFSELYTDLFRPLDNRDSLWYNDITILENERMVEMLVGYCDGGCNNKTHSGAYGSFLLKELNSVYQEETTIVHTKCLFPNCRTSNEAEYEILVQLLTWLLKNNYSKEKGTEEILIFSDSKVVVNHVNGGWKCNSTNLVNKRETVMALLKKLRNVKLLWTPREEIVSILGH